MNWFIIKDFQSNSNTQTTTLENNSLLVGRFAKIIDSEFEGSGEIDDFSCINRSKLGFGSGIGVASYVADTEIGRYTMIGSRVSIGGFEHPTTGLTVAPFQWGQSIGKFNLSSEAQSKLVKRKKPVSRRTYIGSDVWIGNNAVIKSGVRIEHGAVVGAGSVVTKDIGPYEIHVGNPSRLLKLRLNQKQIESLLRISWWNFPIESLASLDLENVQKSIDELQSMMEDFDSKNI